METHLNLAHRSHRKAEYYSKCHQFSEAIFHYSKASEYLDKAIISTKCDNIRASLIVQRNYNIDQIEFLKRRLYNKIKKDLNQASDQNKAPDQAPARPFSAMNFDELKYPELSQLINQQDSLLKQLTNRQNSSRTSPVAHSSTRSSPTNESKSPSANKQTKTEAEIIDDLRMAQEKMRQCVHCLVDSLEKSQQEVHNLKDENSQLRKERAALKATATHKTIPELPPLEPPKLLY